MLIDAEPLTDFASKIFLSLGATSERAATVASHLVEANLKGHDSHVAACVSSAQRRLWTAPPPTGRIYTLSTHMALAGGPHCHPLFFPLNR